MPLGWLRNWHNFSNRSNTGYFKINSFTFCLFFCRIETYKKPFQCDFCEATFSLQCNSKSILHLFMRGRIHSNVYDYICSQKWILVKHFSSVNEKKKTFQCDICVYTCSWKVTLKQQFMRGRNPLSVMFVMQNFPTNQTWKDMWHMSIKQ